MAALCERLVERQQLVSVANGDQNWRFVMVQEWGSKGIQTTTNVDHLGVTVPGLKQAATFFVDVLGADYCFLSTKVRVRKTLRI